MSFAGQIEIALCCRQQRISNVSIINSRPLSLTRSFHGKPVEQVLAMIPLLYSVCGQAQGLCAYLAINRAQGMPSENLHARYASVLMETLREQCWRIFLDWPALLQRPLDTPALQALIKLESALKQVLAHSHTPNPQGSSNTAIDLAGRIRSWLDQTLFAGELNAWQPVTQWRDALSWSQSNASLAASMLDFIHRQDWAGLGKNPVPSLPDPCLSGLQEISNWEDFAHTPEWQQCCAETSVLSRQMHHPLIQDSHHQWGNGLMTRTLARLLEVAQLADTLQHLFKHPGDTAMNFHSACQQQAGIAQLQAARGLLIHRVKLDQEHVTDYQIIAPTEWNFHPRGVVAQALAQLSWDTEKHLRKQAACLIQAIDPCVNFSVSIDATTAFSIAERT